MRDLPLLRKDIQIPINRSAADSRVFCTDLQIDLVRARMVMVFLYRFQNNFTLPCVSSSLISSTQKQKRARIPQAHGLFVKNPDFPPLSMSR